MPPGHIDLVEFRHRTLVNGHVVVGFAQVGAVWADTLDRHRRCRVELGQVLDQFTYRGPVGSVVSEPT